jgi:plasmid stabilization system protein ParE
MRVVVLDNVSADLAETWAWYEAAQEGLGTEFLEEVYRMLDHIWLHPKSGTVYKRKYRQAFLLRFPYVIMYEIEEVQVVVYAVLHTSRHPKSRKRGNVF